MANFPPRAPSGNPSTSPSSSPSGSSVPPGNTNAEGGSGIAGMRTAGVRPCASCGTLVNVHATVCPNCGEHVAAKEKTIRCRRCRHRASSNLVVCPHCGRDLQPGASRWLTWGVPLLILLVLGGAVLVRAGRGDPATWAQAQVERVVRLVESLGSRLQPDVTISMIPAGQDPNDPLVSQAVQAGVELNAAPGNDGQVVVEVAAEGAEVTTTGAAAGAAGVDTAGASEAVEPPAPAAEAAVPIAATEPAPTATATPPPTATAEPTVAPTATPAPTSTTAATPTEAATATSTPATAKGTATLPAALAATRALTRTAATAAPLARAVTTGTPAATEAVSLFGLATPTPVPPEPTATPTVAVTPTPAVLAVHEVQPGDTLFEIATAYDVTVEDILAANSLTEDDVYTIQPGDEVNIPAPTPEGGPTATPAPVPATYTVRAGDTMLAIALRNDVAVDDLLAANGMTINDARSLQPGDEVIIPGAEGAATPTPTSAASATPTQAPTRTPAQTPGATPSPAAVAPENSIRVDAPRLRAPENGTSVSCSGQSSLTWLQVPSVRPSDLYLVHLGYVNSVTNGSEEVIWVISQQRPISTNSWDLDNDLCGLAPNTAGKQWRWYVEVAESTADGLRPVSAASPVWGFTWQ